MTVNGHRRFAVMAGVVTLALMFVLIVLAQSSGAAPSTTLVINEIDYDQPSTDTAEFIELKNVSAGGIDLSGYTLEFVNGATSPPSVYDTIALPAVSLAAGDYFVVCANMTTVANCDLDDGPDENFIQNGAPDAVALKQGATIIDTVSYEGDTPGYTEGSGVGLVDTAAGAESISRCPDGSDTDSNNADFGLQAITPGATNSCPEPPPPPQPFGTCGDGTETLIHAVQGPGATTPLADLVRVVEGVVVGDFEGSSAFNGFYVQEEDADVDADPQTSEGLFVFAPSSPGVSVGDLVRVRGTVTEFSGLTELTTVIDLSVCSSGNPLPTITNVSLPLASADALEPYEGMYVNLPQSLVISEYFNFDRFGELVLALPLSGETRPFTGTAIESPGSDALDRMQANLLRRITLDDGLNTQNPASLRHPNGSPFSLTNRFRGGDTVTNTAGVMDYRFNLYRVQPTAPATYASLNPRPASPEPVGGTLRVSAFNTLNYFLTLDYAPGNPLDNKCGPLQNVECRGADDATEFTRQRAKLLAALEGIGADVIGLNELENTTGVEPLADIVSGLNDSLGAGTYAYVDTGTIGSDAIKVGLIYKPSMVTPVGDFEVLDSTDDPRFIDTLNRPTLAQTFEEIATGARFTVAVNHLKSKGSDCIAVGDPDTGDGQGNCNGTRTLAAQALVDWLATDPTGSGDPDFLIIGDLNSYAMEDPITAIKAGPDDTASTPDDYVNLISHYQGMYAYSYVFDGQFGYLDHALASPSLAEQVTGATDWHINADEPDVLDYDTSFKPAEQDALYEPNAYRSSDHDPVIVGLGLCETTPPTLSVSVSPSTLFPPNHKYVTVQATINASDNSGEEPTVTLDSVTSNEPDNGPGSSDGNTVDDIVIVDDDTFRLRAERDENGTGRVYTITYTATDDCGNSTTRSATVTVPIRR